jgi:hypothetical protein
MPSRFLLLIIMFALPRAASAQIGASLEDCEKQFGSIVETYRYDEGRATEYEFRVDAYEIGVVPLHGRIVRITISSKTAFDDETVSALLTQYSRMGHWKPHPKKSRAVTSAFPALIADFPGWRFFTTDDGTLYAALYRMDFSSMPHKLSITTENFQTELKKLPPVPKE